MVEEVDLVHFAMTSGSINTYLAHGFQFGRNLEHAPRRVNNFLYGNTISQLGQDESTLFNHLKNGLWWHHRLLSFLGYRFQKQ